jgi:hypothetical protein
MGVLLMQVTARKKAKTLAPGVDKYIDNIYNRQQIYYRSLFPFIEDLLRQHSLGPTNPFF